MLGTNADQSLICNVKKLCVGCLSVFFGGTSFQNFWVLLA
jgi:hypothetical protein